MNIKHAVFNIAFLALLAWCVYYIESQPFGISSKKEQKRIEDYKLSGFSVTKYANSGAINLMVQGETLTHFTDNTANLSEISGSLLVDSKSNINSWNMKAKRGSMNLDTGKLQLIDTVELQQISDHKAFSPITLSTQELFIDKAEQIIETDYPISIHSASGNISGKGLRANLEQRTMRIKSRVTSIYELQ